jgi:hypothetical protein
VAVTPAPVAVTPSEVNVWFPDRVVGLDAVVVAAPAGAASTRSPVAPVMTNPVTPRQTQAKVRATRRGEKRELVDLRACTMTALLLRGHLRLSSRCGGTIRNTPDVSSGQSWVTKNRSESGDSSRDRHTVLRQTTSTSGGRRLKTKATQLSVRAQRALSLLVDLRRSGACDSTEIEPQLRTSAFAKSVVYSFSWFPSQAGEWRLVVTFPKRIIEVSLTPDRQRYARLECRRIPEPQCVDQEEG